MLKLLKCAIFINIALFLFSFTFLRNKNLMLLNLMSCILCYFPIFINSQSGKEK